MLRPFNTSLNPWQILDDMRQTLDRPFRETALYQSDNPVDVIEDNDAIVVIMNLPGVKPEDVKLGLENTTLTIQAKLIQNTDQRYLWRERSGVDIKRVIKLPVRLNPDATQANLEHGVLTVRIAKAAEATARQIPINFGRTAPAMQG
jgi:HSP20 family protein